MRTLLLIFSTLLVRLINSYSFAYPPQSSDTLINRCLPTVIQIPRYQLGSVFQLVKFGLRHLVKRLPTIWLLAGAIANRSVSDPDSVNTVQDFDSGFSVNPDPDLWWPNFVSSWKKCLCFGLTNATVLFSEGLSSYRRSVQPPKENIQHFKTWNIFIVLWVIWGNGLSRAEAEIRSVRVEKGASGGAS